jgi:hypothetical protein
VIGDAGAAVRMIRLLTRPKCVITIHAVVLFVLWSLGGFILSDGWSRIDSNPARDLLYSLFCHVIPTVIVIASAHIAAAIARPRVWVPSTLLAALLGGAGPLLLHLSIVTTDDPVAAMGYLSLVQFSAAFFVLALLTMCGLFSWIHRRRGSRNVER